MTYIVNESCIKCKLMDCVEVCPVDCFYEGENMLVIHPDECIDCGVCEPECPVDAIKPDTEPGAEKWLKLNADYAKTWPNITVKRAPSADSKEWEGKPDNVGRLVPQAVDGTEVRKADLVLVSNEHFDHGSPLDVGDVVARTCAQVVAPGESLAV